MMMADSDSADRSVLAERHAQRTAMIESARAFASRIDPAVGLQAAVVFGSVARGDFNVWSDIDLLLIAERLPARPQDRLLALGDKVENAPPGLAPVIWTPDEFRSQLNRGNPIAREAVERGVVVWGSDALGRLAATSGRSER